jgi:ABC-type uncharacterized transport system permease subunit
MALGVLVNSVVEFCGANKGVVEAVPARDNWLYWLKYILVLVGSFSVNTTLAISKKVVLLRCPNMVDYINQHAKGTLLPPFLQVSCLRFVLVLVVVVRVLIKAKDNHLSY